MLLVLLHKCICKAKMVILASCRGHGLLAPKSAYEERQG